MPPLATVQESNLFLRGSLSPPTSPFKGTKARPRGACTGYVFVFQRSFLSLILLYPQIY